MSLCGTGALSRMYMGAIMNGAMPGLSMPHSSLILLLFVDCGSVLLLRKPLPRQLLCACGSVILPAVVCIAPGGSQCWPFCESYHCE